MIKKVGVVLLTVMIFILGSVSVIYAQNNGDGEGNSGGNEGNSGGNEGNSGGNSSEVSAEEESNGLYGIGLKLGLRGAVEISALNLIMGETSGNQKIECQPVWGDIGLTVYYEIMKDMYIGADIFYTFNGLLSIHAGYLQDFIEGPVNVGVKATVGYDMYIDNDLDIAHGFGLQALFSGGYDVMDWLEVGGDLGVNFAMIFTDINKEPVKVVFVNIPLRVFIRVKF